MGLCRAKSRNIEGGFGRFIYKFHIWLDKLSTGQLWIMLIKKLSNIINLTISRIYSYPQNLCTKSTKLWTNIEECE